MTRIRYIRYGPVLISENVFVDNDVMSVYIAIEECEYSILNGRSEIVAQGKGKSLRDAKRLARQAIIALGANLNDEVRRR